MQALKGLLDSKVVDYDFEFYQLPQPADAAVTLLSPAGSLFKDSVDLVLPLAPSGAFGKLPSVSTLQGCGTLQAFSTSLYTWIHADIRAAHEGGLSYIHAFNT